MMKHPDVYLIGEIGQAHGGSLGMAHAYIDALAPTGIQAVKFQMHIAEAESSPFEAFRVPIPYFTGSRMDYWKTMEFTPEEWHQLKTHCEDKKLDFIVTPCSIQAVNLLENLGVSQYKVGSGDTYNLLLLERLVQTKKELLISTGMSSTTELTGTCRYLQKNKAKFSLLQCTSAYPAHETQWGLNQIQALRNQYQVPTGFSDHSGDVFAGLAAVTLGAEILEFHVTFEPRSYGPDASSSLNLDQIKMLTTGVRKITMALSHPMDKNQIQDMEDTKRIFEKSLAVNKCLPIGHPLTRADLESKKPAGLGLPVHHFESVLGKRLRRNLKQGSFLTQNDIL